MNEDEWEAEMDKMERRSVCKCQGDCGLDEMEVALIKAGGRCLWSKCKKRGRPPSMAYKNWHIFTCHCDAKMREHNHIVPSYFCTTRCERKWKASSENLWTKENIEEKKKAGGTFHVLGPKDGKSATLLDDGVRCGFCGKLEKELGSKMLKCGKCKREAYCSKEHQVAAWKKDHKKKCEPAV